MSFFKIGLKVVLCLGLCAQAVAEVSRPTIGLVLGGGGAKGAAHVGVLKYLEEQRIPVDIVVGTSAGSAVAALYAMGQSASDIKRTFLSTEWEKGYIDSTPRPDLSIRRKQDQRQFAIDFDFGYGNDRFLIPKGVVQGQRLQILLNEMTLTAATIEDFDQLPLRYRAVATDLETGEAVVIGRGNLAKAIRASMAVPGVFSPVVIDELTLVDGGLANNLPINVARDLGADIIIAVDLATPLRKSEQLATSLEVLEQLTDFMTHSNTQAQVNTLGNRDIYIQPEFGDIGSASFDRVEETIQLGEQAAKTHSTKLQSLSISEADYQHYEHQRQSFSQTRPLINDIKLLNYSHLNNEIILEKIRQKTGEAFDPEQLEKDLGTVYGLGYFESITYLLETDAHQQTSLIIEAKPKSWGPNFIRFGIEMEDNFKGESDYGLTASVLTTGINRFGAEWVNTGRIGSSPSFFSEFYQPLSFNGDIFARAHGSISRFEVAAFEAGSSTATYEVQDHQLGLELGKQFGTHADFAVGLENGGGKADVLVGDPSLPTVRFDSGAYYLRTLYDRLDDQFFASEGLFVKARYAFSREELGADQNNDRLTLETLYADRLSEWRVNFTARGSFLTKQRGSIDDDFRLGGLFNLSGYATNELSNDEGFLVSTRIFKQVGQRIPWFLGGSIEAGSVYERGASLAWRDLELSGNLFIAANTFLGPIILAYGYANSDAQAVYFSIGNTF